MAARCWFLHLIIYLKDAQPHARPLAVSLQFFCNTSQNNAANRLSGPSSDASSRSLELDGNGDQPNKTLEELTQFPYLLRGVSVPNALSWQVLEVFRSSCVCSYH